MAQVIESDVPVIGGGAAAGGISDADYKVFPFHPSYDLWHRTQGTHGQGGLTTRILEHLAKLG